MAGRSRGILVSHAFVRSGSPNLLSQAETEHRSPYSAWLCPHDELSCNKIAMNYCSRDEGQDPDHTIGTVVIMC